MTSGGWMPIGVGELRRHLEGRLCLSCSDPIDVRDPDVFYCTACDPIPGPLGELAIEAGSRLSVRSRPGRRLYRLGQWMLRWGWRDR